MLLVAPAWDLVWLLTSVAHQATALLLSPRPGWESLFFHLSGHSIQCASCLDCRKLMPTPTAPYANSACKALPQTLFFRKPTSHPYHACLFRSLHTCPCCIPTWFQPGGKQQLPRLLLLALYQACASPGPFVPPLLVRGPGIFLGRSSLPFWTTSVYRIFSEF